MDGIFHPFVCAKMMELVQETLMKKKSSRMPSKIILTFLLGEPKDDDVLIMLSTGICVK